MNLDFLYDLNIAGVQWELNETSTDFNIKNIKPNENENKSDNPSKKHLVIPSTEPISESFAISATAATNDVQKLNKTIADFNHPLRKFVKNTVLPHYGNKNGGLLIVTDLPSNDDDESGNILSGTVGELLDKMLCAINLNRIDVSVVSLLFWRTPGGRTPTTEELSLSRPFVDKFIELIKPDVILTLGVLTAKEILNIKLNDSHGIPVEYKTAPVVPIYHPNYLLLKPDVKPDIWHALQKLQILLKNAEK